MTTIHDRSVPLKGVHYLSRSDDPKVFATAQHLQIDFRANAVVYGQGQCCQPMGSGRSPVTVPTRLNRERAPEGPSRRGPAELRPPNRGPTKPNYAPIAPSDATGLAGIEPAGHGERLAFDRRSGRGPRTRPACSTFGMPMDCPPSSKSSGIRHPDGSRSGSPDPRSAAPVVLPGGRSRRPTTAVAPQPPRLFRQPFPHRFPRCQERSVRSAGYVHPIRHRSDLEYRRRGVVAALLSQPLHRCHIVNICGDSSLYSELSKALHPLCEPKRTCLAPRSGDGQS